jgi:predicted enzyme related to lactoylglutathione lyase
MERNLTEAATPGSRSSLEARTAPEEVVSRYPKPRRLIVSAIAKFALVALDTADPEGLAEFYAAVTGWAIEPHDGPGWIELKSDSGATIAFQLAPGHVPPQWPSDEHPQQLHIDFDVPDLDAAETEVLAIGARKAEVQPGTTFRVFLDPAGHPFCLVRE